MILPYIYTLPFHVCVYIPCDATRVMFGFKGSRFVILSTSGRQHCVEFSRAGLDATLILMVFDSVFDLIWSEIYLHSAVSSCLSCFSFLKD